MCLCVTIWNRSFFGRDRFKYLAIDEVCMHWSNYKMYWLKYDDVIEFVVKSQEKWSEMIQNVSKI